MARGGAGNLGDRGRGLGDSSKLGDRGGVADRAGERRIGAGAETDSPARAVWPIEAAARELPVPAEMVVRLVDSVRAAMFETRALAVRRAVRPPEDIGGVARMEAAAGEAEPIV